MNSPLDRDIQSTVTSPQDPTNQTITQVKANYGIVLRSVDENLREMAISFIGAYGFTSELKKLIEGSVWFNNLIEGNINLSIINEELKIVKQFVDYISTTKHPDISIGVNRFYSIVMKKDNLPSQLITQGTIEQIYNSTCERTLA